ncbi:MAG: hypothetical protein ABSC92_14485, partial [Rhizomicrobium sp.]
MRPETYDFLGNMSAVWTVLLGALLATGGGFCATQLERHLEHRRRERNAAILFAELLSMLGIILNLTHEAYGRGEPFGPLTLRLLRSARREIDIYDRNRESLFDIRDAVLRAWIHCVVLSLAMPMDEVFDATQEIMAEQVLLKSSPDLPDLRRLEIEEHIADLLSRRAGSYDFVQESAVDLKQV